MAISWSDVTAIAADLASIPTATQNKILAIVARQVDDDAWGEFADDGKAFLAAHLASTIYNNTSGAITSESLGPMSRSYGGGSSDPGLLSSAYGVEYLRLLRIAVGPCVFTVP